MKVAVICSEFNKELVEDLYQQAYQEFEKYQLQAQKLLSQSSLALSQSLLQESSVDLQFIQGQSELKKWTKLLPLKQKGSLIQQFMKKVTNGEIEPYWVPGAGEIPLTAQWLMEEKTAQAILALGVIIKGQTAHYDFLCGFLQKALWELQKTYSLPIIFSILMVENRQQAEERVKKSRGAEGMKSLIQMMELGQSLKSKDS